MTFSSWSMRTAHYKYGMDFLDIDMTNTEITMVQQFMSKQF
ncbi:hypothetical protein [Streptococcus sp. SS-4456]